MTASAAPRRPYPARYCGRDFTPAELDIIAQLAATLPTRRAIADAVCDALPWRRADGRRKDMTARVALNRMAADGLITLPPPRHGNGNGRHPRHAPAQQLALPVQAAPITAGLAGLQPLRLVPVASRAESARYNQLMRCRQRRRWSPGSFSPSRWFAFALKPTSRPPGPGPRRHPALMRDRGDDRRCSHSDGHDRASTSRLYPCDGCCTSLLYVWRFYKQAGLVLRTAQSASIAPGTSA